LWGLNPDLTNRKFPESSDLGVSWNWLPQYGQMLNSGDGENIQWLSLLLYFH
jgi:hypothetical protein